MVLRQPGSRRTLGRVKKVPSAHTQPLQVLDDGLQPPPHSVGARDPTSFRELIEDGTIGSTPAIHNAVVDAVSHLGVTHIDMPCTAERVWQAIQAAAS
jgi:hypothetical protein